MKTFLILLALIVAFVVGNTLTLLRTAKTPKIPEGVKPIPYDDEE